MTTFPLTFPLLPASEKNKREGRFLTGISGEFPLPSRFFFPLFSLPGNPRFTGLSRFLPASSRFPPYPPYRRIRAAYGADAAPQGMFHSIT